MARRAALSAPAATLPLAVADQILFQLPAGFVVKAGAPSPLMIAGPDPTLRIAISLATDPLEAAVGRGWRALGRPALKPQDVVRPPSAREPWSQSIVVNYEPEKDTQARVWVRQAVAHRYRDQSYVILLEGPLAEIKKRSAQLREIVGSVRPKGAKETVLGPKDVRTPSAAELAALQRFVEAARQRLEVPGVAVAVVQRGKVLARFGAGYRDLQRRAPVTPRTHFMIGSITKSFTAMMIGRLVAAGRLAWNAQVQSLMPGFRLADAAQTKALELAHLLCACTGVPRKDLPLLFAWEKASPESVMRDLAGLKLLTAFGETFQYSNQLVAAAGFIAAQVAGKGRGLGAKYAELLRRMVLAPLGMNDTFVDFDHVLALKRYALPHSEAITSAAPRAAEIRPVSLRGERFVLPYAPAGALWSTAEDFAKLLVALTGGPGKEVLPATLMQKLWAPQVRIAAHASYGLGWMSARYKGMSIYSHGGGTLGFSAYFAYFPLAEMGFVMLTNGTRGGALRGLLEKKMLSVFFGEKDDLEQRLVFTEGLVAKGLLALRKKTGVAVDAKRLSRLVGRYHHPELGTVKVLRRGQRALLDVGYAQMGFLPQPKGTKDEMYIIVDPPLTGFSFWVETEAGQPTLNFEPNTIRYTLKRR